MLTKKSRVKEASRAFAIHLLASSVMAVAVGVLVFCLWFPYPYGALAGGQHLFWMLVLIDVICGPLLTGVVFNSSKPKKELFLDLSVIALMQLMALFYGIHTISLSRPVHLVFEKDRFVSVASADVYVDHISKAPKEFQRMPWFGPTLLGTRAAKDSDEVIQSISLSAQGFEPSSRPDWWQDYSLNRPEVKSRMLGLVDLRNSSSEDIKSSIDHAVAKAGGDIGRLYYLPLVGKKSLDEWIVLLNRDADIVGYAVADGFMR